MNAHLPNGQLDYKYVLTFLLTIFIFIWYRCCMSKISVSSLNNKIYCCDDNINVIWLFDCNYGAEHTVMQQKRQLVSLNSQNLRFSLPWTVVIITLIGRYHTKTCLVMYVVNLVPFVGEFHHLIPTTTAKVGDVTTVLYI